jgi:hypothetical protein
MDDFCATLALLRPLASELRRWRNPPADGKAGAEAAAAELPEGGAGGGAEGGTIPSGPSADKSAPIASLMACE